MRRLEWQQLEYFKTVAELEHFHQAAEILNISQSALSRSISKLEKSLGLPLFDRNGRGVVLNRYGKMFYKRTCRILQEMAEAKQEIKELFDPENGVVSLAFLKSLGVSYIPNILNIFLSEHPNINFQLFQSSTAEMIEQLEEGIIDFCITSEIQNQKGIKWIELWKEELFFFVHKNHRLANRKNLTLAELCNEKFIVLKKGYSIRTIFDELCLDANLKPNITFESDEIVTIVGFVSENLGIALLPKLQGVHMDNIQALQISEFNCERVIGFALKEERFLSPVAHKFLAFLVEHSQQHN
ncbi:LysR family transcriptional regulator [Neobacillus sp. LXY-4]|uniref:LysR family transcriptional regulator n=1 Tax=Neobacillus sp. LXY-4 TaxID=3379826 RepID=UPI003EE24680